MEQQHTLGLFRYHWIGINYRKGTEDEKVLDHSFDRDIFLREIPSFRPSKNSVIVDVGAHIGTFSLLCALRFPEARIHAFEASHETFEILAENIRCNNLRQVSAYHQAMAGQTGKVRLFHSVKTGNWGHSITRAFSSSYEEVDATTLEAFVVERAIPFIDLIKFNCEGAEFEIIVNTPEAILKKIGVAIILYHEDLDEVHGNASNIAHLFRRLGFRVDTIPKAKDRGWIIVWNRSRYSFAFFLWKAIVRRIHR